MRNRILIILGVLFLVGLGLYFAGIRMTDADLHISAKAEPVFCIGGQLEGEECSPGTIFPVTNSLILTVIVDLLLLALILFGVRNMQLVPRGLQNVIEVVIEAFYNFALGVDRKNVAKFFALPATIFLFFLLGNLAGLLPTVGSVGWCVEKHAEEAAPASTIEGASGEGEAAVAEGTAAQDAGKEKVGPSAIFAGLPGYCPAGNFVLPWLRAPAADLNVTIAWALVAVFMIEFYGFQALGLGYLGKFFINPLKGGAINTFVGLLEFVSEIMRIVAFAFRIFGNIFGGEVILVVMSFLFPFILPLPFYGFEVFVAFIQAVIFAVLTLVFSSLAVQAHGHDDHGHAEPVESPAAH
jgi:F-type H+-transporting ATPase subunit a